MQLSSKNLHKFWVADFSKYDTIDPIHCRDFVNFTSWFQGLSLCSLKGGFIFSPEGHKWVESFFLYRYFLRTFTLFMEQCRHLLAGLYYYFKTVEIADAM